MNLPIAQGTPDSRLNLHRMPLEDTQLLVNNSRQMSNTGGFQMTPRLRFLDEVGLAGRIGVFHCRPRFISLTASGAYHGPACQVTRLSWPDISSEKPSCARRDEKELAVVSSRQRLTHRATGVGMLIMDERPETNFYFWTGGLLMCTSSMGRHTCST
jgi:hypothetical protein